MPGAEPGHRLVEFATAHLREGVLAVRGVVGELGRDDLAVLTEGARDDVHLVPGRDVMGDGDAARERLVVGVGVDEDEPRHASTSRTCGKWQATT